MTLNSKIRYKGALACFEIQRDAPGIYSADLLYYEGRKDQSPPGKITLIRGLYHWTGSVEDKRLLDELGTTIRTYLRKHYPTQRPEH